MQSIHHLVNYRRVTARAAAVVEFRARDADRTQQEILRAAMTEFADHGFGGARIDAIAERAGVNKKLIYYYFDGKDPLFLAALEQTYADIRSAEQALHLEADWRRWRRSSNLVAFTWRPLSGAPRIPGAAQQREHARRRPPQALAPDPADELAADRRRSPTCWCAASRAASCGRGIDPMQLYISIAGLAYFYLSNNHTLSAVFGRELMTPAARDERLAHISAVILCLRRRARGPGAVLPRAPSPHRFHKQILRRHPMQEPACLAPSHRPAPGPRARPVAAAPWRRTGSLPGHHLIVPWAAGGSTDQVTRVTAGELEKALGQTIVVVNQPGASGAIGTKSALDAAKDGYTWTAGAAQDLGTYQTLGSSRPASRLEPVPQRRQHPADRRQPHAPYQTAKELLDAMKAQARPDLRGHRRRHLGRPHRDGPDREGHRRQVQAKSPTTAATPPWWPPSRARPTSPPSSPSSRPT